MTPYFSTALSLILVTVVAFAVGNLMYEKSGKFPLLQPVLIATSIVAVFLKITDLPYDMYFQATKPLHDLLGPTIVALAVPLYANLAKARFLLFPIFATIIVGGCVVTLSAIFLGWCFGLGEPMNLALATKSVTAPIAVLIAEKIGTGGPLIIFTVFLTGIFGVIVIPNLLRVLGITDRAVIGLTLGLTSHTFGIARSADFGSESMAFATLGMSLMGCACAVLIPVLFRLL